MINLELKTDKPTGEVVFQGGTIITMNGDEVIEDGVVVVEDNKIKAIGKNGEVTWSGNAKIIDTPIVNILNFLFLRPDAS